jgi:hypothetical protein
MSAKGPAPVGRIDPPARHLASPRPPEPPIVTEAGIRVHRFRNDCAMGPVSRDRPQDRPSSFVPASGTGCRFAGTGQDEVDDTRLFLTDEAASRKKLDKAREEILAASPEETFLRFLREGCRGRLRRTHASSRGSGPSSECTARCSPGLVLDIGQPRLCGAALISRHCLSYSSRRRYQLRGPSGARVSFRPRGPDPATGACPTARPGRARPLERPACAHL